MKRIILIVMVCLLVGCTNNVKPNSDSQTGSNSHGCSVLAPCGDEKADMSVYENFMDTDHVFVNTSFDEVFKAIENEQTFVLYLGFSTCPWCLEAMPILNEVAKEFDATVSYINTRPDHTRESELRVEDNPDYVQFVELMEEYLSENEEGEKHLYVPFVFFISKGEVIAWHEDTFPEHDAHERQMTEEEVERLRQIYQSGFESLMSE